MTSAGSHTGDGPGPKRPERGIWGPFGWPMIRTYSHTAMVVHARRFCRDLSGREIGNSTNRGLWSPSNDLTPPSESERFCGIARTVRDSRDGSRRQQQRHGAERSGENMSEETRQSPSPSEVGFTVDRRNVLKGAAAVSGVAAFGGLLAACGSDDSEHRQRRRFRRWRNRRRLGHAPGRLQLRQRKAQRSAKGGARYASPTRPSRSS